MEKLGSTVRFGVFDADFRTQELRKQGVRVKLPQQSFQILQMLLEQPGELVTRDQLRQALWPGDTFVDFDHGVNNSIKRIRDALGDSAESPRYIETLPRLGYRFVAPVETQNLADLDSARVTVSAKAGAAKASGPRWKLILPAAVAVLALSVTGYFYFHRPPKLTDKDTIVLAEFTNTTGDTVFDGTLRQGLSVQLDQSPFLSLVSEKKVQQNLQMMGQKPDAKLTPEIARELCQRTASAAVLEGSIAQIGTQYLLTLKAVNCSNGESLASAEAQASDKNHVLDALGKVASEIRSKLGESLASVQKYDAPAENVTTASLEALRAYSLGYQAMIVKSDPPAAVSLFQRAIS